MKRLFFLLFLIVVPVLFAQVSGLKELELTLKNWADGFNSGDYQKAISIYDKNFIGYYPNQSDQTYKSIEEQYHHIFGNKNLSVKISFKADEIKVYGNIAYVRMQLSAIIKPAFSTQPVVATDKGLEIWNKDSDGEWKLVRSSTFPVEGKNDSQ